MKLLELVDEIKLWIDQYPWLDMLTSLSIVILAAIVANFIAKHIVVKGLHRIISRLNFSDKPLFLSNKLINFWIFQSFITIIIIRPFSSK